MTPEEKRDLIEFITKWIMDWYLDDRGYYRENGTKRFIGYVAGERRGPWCPFDPVENALHWELLMEKMFNLGFHSAVYTDRELSVKDTLDKGEPYGTIVYGEKYYLAKFIKPNINSKYAAKHKGVAVCIAAQRAILRQKDLEEGERQRFYLNEAMEYSQGEREYHGN